VRTIAAAENSEPGVFTRAELIAMGCTRSQIKARIAADRWRAIGTAVVLDNHELTREQRQLVAVLNCGPRAQLASFTAAEVCGLTGWERDEVHVLAPAGVARPRLIGLPVILHRARHIDPTTVIPGQRRQRIAPALVLAAASFPKARPAAGLLAAGVQQRLTDATHLRAALHLKPTVRHHRALLHAVDDIEMGAEALSELDFVRLCRRHGLPAPIQQGVRVEPSGRRRYLDAEWRLPDGQRVVVEVDGAVHLAPRRWFDDQLRQNELALTGSLILRYPSVVVRTEPELVIGQLRRALRTKP
jgi:hypothetical protein